MLARSAKIGFLLLVWAIVGTCLCVFILSRLQFVDNGFYLLIPTWLLDKPIDYFFPHLDAETDQLLFWFSYGFINLVVISLIIFAGYRVYKHFKKLK